ncbi:hypothetical protein B484DRAFT_453610 [Ochromonadaceae sp. CCMP2298]|nr:hypothetical protein B484DRAFT_453610 [Ochromonadaceae sp. CCMP2298]
MENKHSSALNAEAKQSFRQQQPVGRTLDDHLEDGVEISAYVPQVYIHSLYLEGAFDLQRMQDVLFGHNWGPDDVIESCVLLDGTYTRMQLYNKLWTTNWRVPGCPICTRSVVPPKQADASQQTDVVGEEGELKRKSVRFEGAMISPGSSVSAANDGGV